MTARPNCPDCGEYHCECFDPVAEARVKADLDRLAKQMCERAAERRLAEQVERDLRFTMQKDAA